MRKRMAGSVIIILFVIFMPLYPVTIRLASLAHRGSSWDNGLCKIAAQWSVITQEKIKIVVYPGGVAGGDDTVIQKIRNGQLDAATLTGAGLSRIYPGILSVQLPLMMQTDDEVYYLLERLKAVFERELENKGFKIVLWVKIGWIYFFSKNPVVIPDDLRAHKLFAYKGDVNGVQAWRDEGFNPLPLAAEDLVLSLQNGVVDALAATPSAAAAGQWFRYTKNMMQLRWAPLIGAVVVATSVWEKIPRRFHEQLLESAEHIGRQIQKEIDQTDEHAIALMKDRGLRLQPLAPPHVKKWETLAHSVYRSVIGKSFDEQSYQKIIDILNAFRDKNRDDSR